MTRRVGPHGLAVLAAAALLAGCGTQTAGTGPTSTEETGPATTAPGGSGAETATQTPAVKPEPTASASATPPAARPATLQERLLPADELPGFHRGFTWEATSTRASEGPALSGICHRFEMLSIGAEKVVRRDYEPADASPGSASELVAQFPDVKTAKRAYAVLGSWHDQCHVDNGEVDDLDVVRLSDAVGAWYLVTYGSTFDAQGFVRRGALIAVLQLRTEGQDYHYPAGKEPMVRAVRRAAARL